MKVAVTSAALLFALTACEEPTPPAPLPPSADAPAPTVTSTVRARLRTYYVENVDEICWLYWLEAAKSSQRLEIVCPREIDEGERVRLAGRTCFREAATPERSVPVRCPKHLFYAELHDRRGKGEYKLAPE